MPVRYSRAPKIKGGKAYGTYFAGRAIHRAAATGALDVEVITTKESQRLDIIAGDYYSGNGTYWWIIAAASGIGWNLQVPPGTRLVVPTDLGQIEALVG